MALIARGLSHEQAVAVYNHPDTWSAKLATARLSGHTHVAITGGRPVTTDSLHRALIPAFAGRIPSDVWNVLGIRQPSIAQPELAAYLHPLTARLAVATEAYRTTVMNTDPAIRVGLQTGQITISDLLARPVLRQNTEAIFNAIKPIRDEILARVQSDGVEDFVIGTPQLALAPARNPADIDNVFNTPNLPSPTFDVASAWRSATTATAIMTLVRRLDGATRHTDGISRIDELASLAATVSDQSARIQRAMNGEEMGSDDSLMCLPNGTFNQNRSITASQQIPDNIRPFLIDKAKSTTTSLRDHSLDIELNHSVVASVASATTMWGWTGLKAVALALGPASLSTSPAILAASMIAATSSLYLVGLASVEARKGLKNGVFGRRRQETIAARREFVEALAEHNVQTAALEQFDRALNGLYFEVEHEIGMQCQRDYYSLITGQMTGPSVDRTVALLETIGPPPTNLEQLAHYNRLATQTEIRRHLSTAASNVISTTEEALAPEISPRPRHERQPERKLAEPLQQTQTMTDGIDF